MPLKSKPSTAGYDGMADASPDPARVFASIGLMPAATTRTSSSLSTGVGTGTDAS